MKQVFCFGELLLRMSPAAGGQWIGDQCMPVFLGGAELNVAAALSEWGIPVKYCTALPPNDLSIDICGALATKGIDLSAVHQSGSRIGIYYLPQGKDLKHAAVIYDRAHSSFSALRPGMIDWNEALKEVGLFYLSAIGPAVSAGAAAVCLEAVLAAVKKDIPVCIDLNHRVRLWQYGKNPIDIMPGLVEHCTTVMGNIWSANSLLGIPLRTDLHAENKRESYLAHAHETAGEIFRRFPQCKMMAQTFRFDRDPGILYYASLDVPGKQFASADYRLAEVVDKVGSGDCFMAGLLYGIMHHTDPQFQVDFASAAATGKMLETGDSTAQTIAAIQQRIING